MLLLLGAADWWPLQLCAYPVTPPIIHPCELLCTLWVVGCACGLCRLRGDIGALEHQLTAARAEGGALRDMNQQLQQLLSTSREELRGAEVGLHSLCARERGEGEWEQQGEREGECVEDVLEMCRLLSTSREELRGSQSPTQGERD